MSLWLKYKMEVFLILRATVLTGTKLALQGKDKSCSLVYLDPRNRSDRDYESMMGLRASRRTGKWSGWRQMLRALVILSSLMVEG